MSFKDVFVALPTIDQVNTSSFYIHGYSQALCLFSEVRVVYSADWLQGMSEELKAYFIKVGFPNFVVPIFRGYNCYGFVVKGFGKMTPKFCTNELLPGCERLKGGEIVVLVEGFKDCYLPMLACKGLPVVVLPMLTAVPSKELMGALKVSGCRIVSVPDNDEHVANHSARFMELCGKVQIAGTIFNISGVKDFGGFFDPESRVQAMAEAKRLRGFICSSI
jgi:hypothetical protein